MTPMADEVALTIPEAARLIDVKPITITHWLGRYGLFRAEAPTAPAPWRFNRRQILILAAIADLVNGCRLAAPDAIEALRDAPADEYAESGAAFHFRHDDQTGPCMIEVRFRGLWGEIERRMGE